MAAAVSVTTSALTSGSASPSREASVAACATLAPVSVTVTPNPTALATAVAALAAVNSATVPVKADWIVPPVRASSVLNWVTDRLARRPPGVASTTTVIALARKVTTAADGVAAVRAAYESAIE